jgi:hypothetical protein
MAISKATVLLDGVEVSPVDTEHMPNPDGNGPDWVPIGGVFSLFEVELKGYVLRMCLDSESLVDLDSEHKFFKRLAMCDDDLPDAPCILADIVLINSQIVDSAFAGVSTFTNVVLENCCVVNSTMLYNERWGNLQFRTIKNALIETCYLEDNTIRSSCRALTLRNSSLVGNDIENHGVGILIEDSTIDNSTFDVGNVFDIYTSVLSNVVLTVKGFMRLTNQRLENVEFHADSLDLYNKFCSFSLELDTGRLQFHMARTDSGALSMEGYEDVIDVDDPDYREKLIRLLKHSGHPIPEDVAEYIDACVKSRLSVLKKIDDAKQAEFMRALE